MIKYEENNSGDLKLENLGPISEDQIFDSAKVSEFSVTNTGTSRAYININLANIIMDEELKSNDFKWALYETDDNYSDSNQTLIASNSFYNAGSKINMAANIEFQSNEVKYYHLYIYINDNNEKQNDLQNKNFNGQLLIRANQYINKLSDIILKNNKVTKLSDDINFKEVSQVDEELIEGVDNDGKIYYFRGAVKDNYLKFANYLWRIVRVNEDGSIKLIIEKSIGNSKFNDAYAVKYAGYTYDNDKICNTSDPCDKNIGTCSTIKKYIENWYDENLASYDDLIKETLYCNDTSVKNTDGNYIYYGSWFRQTNSYKPTVICPDTEKIMVVHIS